MPCLCWCRCQVFLNSQILSSFCVRLIAHLHNASTSKWVRFFSFIVDFNSLKWNRRTKDKSTENEQHRKYISSITPSNVCHVRMVFLDNENVNFLSFDVKWNSSSLRFLAEILKYLIFRFRRTTYCLFVKHSMPMCHRVINDKTKMWKWKIKITIIFDLTHIRRHWNVLIEFSIIFPFRPRKLKVKWMRKYAYDFICLK